MNSHPETSLWASFAADSLALGAHWVYDPQKIKDNLGRVDRLLAPDLAFFHKGKRAGDFTHYGDQTLVLLESLAARKAFDPHDFAERWKRLFADYGGWMDQATRGTLANFEGGATPENSGSASNDLAGASRIAPLVFLLGREESPEPLVQAAVAQTRMTHNSPEVLAIAALFAKTAWLALRGEEPAKALQAAAAEEDGAVPLSRWVATGLDSVGEDSVAAIQRLGPSCHAPEALAGVAQLLAKYPDDLAEALVQNAMAGGDSAARGMAVGLLLGAGKGVDAIPPAWIEGLQARETIAGLLAGLKES